MAAALELAATPMAQIIRPQAQSAPVATALARAMRGTTPPLTQAVLVGLGSRATSQAPQSTKPAMARTQALDMTERKTLAPAAATAVATAVLAVARLEVAQGMAVVQGMTGTTQALVVAAA